MNLYVDDAARIDSGRRLQRRHRPRQPGRSRPRHHVEQNSLREATRQLLKSYRETPALSEERIARQCPKDLAAGFKRADAQRVVAREYGFESWTRLKRYLESSPPEKLIFVVNDDADAVESLLADDPTLIDARSGWQLYRPLFFAMQQPRNATIEVLRRHGATLDIFEAAAPGGGPDGTAIPGRRLNAL